jgi:hypothetical protein
LIVSFGAEKVKEDNKMSAYILSEYVHECKINSELPTVEGLFKFKRAWRK